MQRQHTATLRTRTQDRWPWLLTACAVALAAAAALGLWQTVDHRQHPASPAVEQPATVTAAAPAARDPLATRRDADRPLTVYIVGSEDEAAHLTGALRAGDQILTALGQPTVGAEVVVAGSPEGADFIAWAIAQADAVRMSIGLPPIAVIDLPHIDVIDLRGR
jgi:hypothetical protein